MTPRFLVSTVAVAAACTLALGSLSASERSVRSSSIGGDLIAGRPAPAKNVTAGADDPDEVRERGIAWLIKRQAKDGGWGAGNWGTDDLSAPSDVATTVVSIMALLRDAGDTDKHSAAIERAALFVVGAVETSPDGPRLDTPTGTQPQHKLGSLVDTHLAAMILGDLAPRFEGETKARLNRGWDKVLGKVQQAQAADGSFADDGWAPVLSGSYAAQSLIKAKEAGRGVVDDDVLEKAERYQAAQVSESGEFATGKAAGVALYSVAGTMKANKDAARRGAASGSAPEAEAAVAQARSVVSADASGALMAGFGSVGGEEMLAYTMISDTLAEDGGDTWDAWETKINSYLSGIQNKDGSWSGHHCITSTTFVTATALMTLGAADHAKLTAARAEGDAPTKL